MGFVNISFDIWIWMAIYTFLLYTLVFFLYSHVNMTIRQVSFFVPAIFVWSLIETHFTCMPSGQFQMIMCNFFELSWLLPTVYLFTENFSLNLIRFSIVSWIANGLSVVALSIYNHKDYLLFSEKKLDEMSWQSMAVFTLSIIIVVILEYPLIHRILPYKPHLKKAYRIAAGLYLIFVSIDYIIEINAAAGGRFVWRGTFKGISALCLIAFIVFLAVMARQRNILEQKKQLTERIELLDKQYDEVVEKNRELHKVRHELNKQAEAVRAVKGYVPEKIRKDMMESITVKTGEALAGMSLSGNLMIDSLLEKYYRELSEKGIVLETVLTPVRFEKKMEDCIVMMQKEMFGFVERFYDNCDCVRYSIRVRNDKIFLLLEAGFRNVSAYKRQKLLDMLGERMIFRQAFGHTNSLIERLDGSLDYEIGKSGVLIGVMIDTLL